MQEMSRYAESNIIAARKKLSWRIKWKKSLAIYFDDWLEVVNEAKEKCWNLILFTHFDIYFYLLLKFACLYCQKIKDKTSGMDQKVFFAITKKNRNKSFFSEMSLFFL